MPQTCRPHARRGFTLVEMLVVIAIVTVLAAILIPALGVGVKRARTAALAAEMNDLAMGLEGFKTKWGDYPPDFCTTQAFVEFVTKAFPNSQVKGAAAQAWITSTNSLTNQAGMYVPSNLDPAEALPFWLSMLSTNVRDPLSGANPNNPAGRQSFYSFKQPQLVDLDNDGWPEYVSPNAVERPYVYFDGRVVAGKYAYVYASYPRQATVQPVTTEIVRPYRSNTPVNVARDRARTFPLNDPAGANTTEWLRPGQFQLIAAGLDNEFGLDFAASNKVVYKTFNDPNYPLAGSPDEDNLANFSEGQTLGDAVP